MSTVNNFPTLLAICLAATMFAGCSMCCDTYDYHYPTVGGKHQRSDPVSGRVGSIFSDPGTLPIGPGPDSNLKEVEMRSRIEGDPDATDRDGETLPDPDRARDNDTALTPWDIRPLRSAWR